MRNLKNAIAIALPEAIFLQATSNEGQTEGDIAEMGYRLSQEILQYIRENCPGNQLARITIIGYSMGGVIARAALPYLDRFKDKFHGFVSLCSPHLGYMYKTSKLFSTGMWILNKWKKSTAITQLRMADGRSIEDCYLYKLSQVQGLGWFKHMMLVSSY